MRIAPNPRVDACALKALETTLGAPTKPLSVPKFDAQFPSKIVAAYQHIARSFRLVLALHRICSKLTAY
ncbi:hypothetical protein Nepgr_028830 [Nepenthes gracilis]|uniref:Uncharacterized protein n=1 Tax=Nepenthes gracilis TaxID=150966 RepID=A0AAD3TED1_NEPGR|nr:hypothetical protein Nepgr_028830 [Nepenthes gracilis]